MDRFEDQNVNTINIPRKHIDGIDKIAEPNTMDLMKSVPVVYKLSLQKTEDSRLPREFDELVKEIVETNNKEFLQGKQNLIEYLISKHAISDSDDLKNLRCISLKVKENFGMLNEFGQYLPNLEELVLSGSILKSVEEIGTSFLNLKILNISNCSVYDLTGIFCFRNLEILDCSYNFICDLIELEMCHSLEKINLKYNEIDEEDNITFLASLPKLEYINFTNNPIVLKENFINSLKKYLSHINKIEHVGV